MGMIGSTLLSIYRFIVYFIVHQNSRICYMEVMNYNMDLDRGNF